MGVYCADARTQGWARDSDPPHQAGRQENHRRKLAGDFLSGQILSFLSSGRRIEPGRTQVLHGSRPTQPCCLVAVDPKDETTRSLGVARWIRSTESPETAEFAVVVIDSYQRIGLGKLFLGYLVKTAMSRGLSKLRGWIHAENKAMRALFRGIGGQLVTQEGPLCCYELMLPTTIKSTARSPSIAPRRAPVEHGKGETLN